MFEVRLLGPVEVWVAGRPVDLGPARQRTVLAALAADVGRPVQVETLIDRVWADAPPQRARHTLHVYLARLRQALREARGSDEAPVELARRSGGYVLCADENCVDAQQFLTLLAAARTNEKNGSSRVSALRQALALWRGVPLAGLSGYWVEQTRQQWRQRRIDATLEWAQEELGLGNAVTVIAAVRALYAEFPLVEPLAATLMRALAMTGREAEALDFFSLVRARLAADLGVDPSEDLQKLYQAILRGEATSSPDTAPVVRTPAQLPPDLAGFVARQEELALLDAMLDQAAQEPVIVAVCGTAGVGKTALAVRWARRVADAFPDGQVYLDLRGFDQGSELTQQEAFRILLQALSVPPQGIPADLESQVGMWRSLLAGRRLLLVLDNAKDADHVRPLLPGSPGCVAVVTSRNVLTGLVAVEGALPLRLDLLSASEAAELLRHRLGADRVASDNDATGQITARCVGLPLALAIVAARASTGPERRLSSLAAELASADGPLDALDGGDPSTDVRTVFSWSYRALSPDGACLFLSLGRHPGRHFTLADAASLLGVPPRRARVLLDELVRAHLLTEPALERYAFHDLLREYAGELALTEQAATAREATFQRLVDHYVQSALIACRLLETGREPIEAQPPLPGVSVAHLAGRADALAWFVVEHRTLLAVVRAAAEAGLSAQAWTLAMAFTGFLDNQGHWTDWAETAGLAVDAAQRLSDPARQARAHRVLARSCVQLGRYSEAEEHYGRAMTLYAEVDDPSGQAATHFSLSWMMELQGHHDESLHHSLRSLDLYGSIGHLIGRARALNSVGWCYANLGDYPQSLSYCTRAIALQQELGDFDGQAATWDTMGYAHHQLGQFQEAVPCYQQAVEFNRRCGDRLNEADVLTHLGDAYHALGRASDAHAAWHQAADLLDGLGHADAESVRARLSGTDA